MRENSSVGSCSETLGKKGGLRFVISLPLCGAIVALLIPGALQEKEKVIR